jgi:hypothetical protein
VPELVHEVFARRLPGTAHLFWTDRSAPRLASAQAPGRRAPNGIQRLMTWHFSTPQWAEHSTVARIHIQWPLGVRRGGSGFPPRRESRFEHPGGLIAARKVDRATGGRTQKLCGTGPWECRPNTVSGMADAARCSAFAVSRETERRERERESFSFVLSRFLIPLICEGTGPGEFRRRSQIHSRVPLPPQLCQKTRRARNSSILFQKISDNDSSDLTISGVSTHVI